MDPLGGVVVDGGPEDRPHQVGDVGDRQALEVEPRHAWFPLHAREPALDRVADREVVRADGQDEQQALAVEVVRQERDEVLGRAVDPVQVLEDHDRGRVRTEVAEQAEDEPEQPRLRETAPRVGVRGRLVGGDAVPGPDRGEQPRDLGPGGAEQRRDAVRRDVPEEPAEGLRERRVRQPVVGEVEAATHEDRAAGRTRALEEIVDEPGLADPGLARDEQDPGRSRRRAREGVVEHARLRGPPDQLATRDQARHPASLRSGHRV